MTEEFIAMRWPSIRTSPNFLAIRIVVLILTAGMTALVVASPVALQWVARIRGINWVNLANIGQTYGAVSALLTALAFGGVLISLLYQARDVKTGREQASRSFHHELLKMEMEDPFYMQITAVPWGVGVGLTDYNSLRRHHFVHMWVSYWESQYVLGEMPDGALRFTVSDQLFVSGAGRRYWSSTRTAKLAAKGRRLRFAKIIDEEYSRAVANGPPVANPPIINPGGVTPADSRRLSRIEFGILICVATGWAILARRLLGRQFFRKP